ncbi:MAG: hypothetical protein AAGG81_07510, partial [Chlamydiota bacterium]
PEEPKGNILTIGPGRMFRDLNKLIKPNGIKTVINTKESFTDYVECGFPLPYDQWFPLNNYQEVDINSQLAKYRQDAITIFAGLHHCPPERLDTFGKSLNKVAADGCHLYLRDHDVRDKEMADLVTVVHSVFNAATGVPFKSEEGEEAEVDEIRNFQSLDYWTKFLDKHGFKQASDPLIRPNDPTDNALVKYIKPDPKMPELLTHEWMISRLEKYVRPKFQTHLTLTEWFNVESCQSLGEFAQKNHFWKYPYFGDTVELWKTLGKSISTAKEAAPLSKVLCSDYMVMSAFITTAMSIEYLTKGILLTPIRMLGYAGERLLPKKEENPNDPWNRPAKVYGEWLHNFGQSLEKTPFYATNYVPDIPMFWKALSISWYEARKERSISQVVFDRQTTLNLTTGVVMTADLLFRAAFATPINLLMGGEELGDQREIGIIVHGVDSLDEVDSRIKTIYQDKENSYQGLKLPRYEELRELLQKLANQGIQFKEIAGQNQMQIEFRVPKGEQNKFYEDIEGVEFLHQRKLLGSSESMVVGLKVDIDQLHVVLKELGNQIHRIYDF